MRRIKNTEATKRKSRFNAPDAAIIAVTLLIVVAAVWRYAVSKWNIGAEYVECEVTFKTSKVVYTVNGMLEDGENGTQFYFENGDVFGRLKSHSYVPSSYYIPGDEGKMESALYDENTYIDVKGTLSAQLILKDGRYITSDGVHIAAGAKLSLKTAGSDLTVEIISVKPVADHTK